MSSSSAFCFSNLPHNHPLKIKERVLDDVEHGVKKFNAVNGVKDLLTFMEEKVFYNDPMTDRYKLWQDITKIMRDKHQTMTAYIDEAEAVFRRAGDVKLVLPKDIQGLMILEGAKLAQHHKQLVAIGCNSEC